MSRMKRSDFSSSQLSVSRTTLASSSRKISWVVSAILVISGRKRVFPRREQNRFASFERRRWSLMRRTRTLRPSSAAKPCRLKAIPSSAAHCPCGSTIIMPWSR